MKILAIETSTEACSAALDINDNCRFRFEVAPRQHTALILPMIDALLLEADIKIKDLDAIAFGNGPGAFTGVRVATGVVQGLAFAHNIPVIPISTLAALAQQFADKYEHIASAIDARIKEVYWGLYKKNEFGLMKPIARETVCSPKNVTLPDDAKWFGAGSGWNTYPDELKSKLGTYYIGAEGKALPNAKDIIQLAKPAYLEGKVLSVEEAMPVYLRDKVVGN